MKQEALKKEMLAGYKLKKLKKQLIAAVIIIVLIPLAGILIWNQGRTHGKEQADQEIAALIEENKRYKQQISDSPMVVNPIAPEISLDVVNSEIRSIGELATMEYFYTNAATYKDAKQIKDLKIPLTEKSLIIKWDGVIKAGMAVDQIATSLDKASKTLTVTLPQAKILSHDPDKDSVEIMYESGGLFNPVTLGDHVKFDAAIEKEMEQRAIENGLLEKAKENAETIIFKLLNANPGIHDIYQIEFRTAEE